MDENTPTDKTLKLFNYKNEDAIEEVVPEDDGIEWESEHPLFMTKLPDNIEENEGLVALQAMKYEDEETPEALAESYKEKGNECFRSCVILAQWKVDIVLTIS